MWKIYFSQNVHHQGEGSILNMSENVVPHSINQDRQDITFRPVT